MTLAWPRGALSPTQLAESRRCPRAHKFKYRDSLRVIAPDDPNLLFGRCGHQALEILGKKILAGYDTDAQAWETAAVEARKDLLASEDPELAGKLTTLISAYRNTFGEENAGYGELELLEVETVLMGGTLLADRGGFACIADAIAKSAEGRLITIEHKFLGKKFYGEDEDVTAKLLLDDQVCALAFCGRERFGEIPLVLYNVLVKTKNPSFQRIYLDLSEKQLQNWEENTRQATAFLDLDCPNLTACNPKGGGFKCDYVGYCHGTDEERELNYEVRERTRRV